MAALHCIIRHLSAHELVPPLLNSFELDISGWQASMLVYRQWPELRSIHIAVIHVTNIYLVTAAFVYMQVHVPECTTHTHTHTHTHIRNEGENLI